MRNFTFMWFHHHASWIFGRIYEKSLLEARNGPFYIPQSWDPCTPQKNHYDREELEEAR